MVDPKNRFFESWKIFQNYLYDDPLKNKNIKRNQKFLHTEVQTDIPMYEWSDSNTSSWVDPAG